MVVVSPIVGGQAIKGPAAKMMKELGVLPTALSIAQHYQDLATAIVIDTSDSGFSAPIQELGMETVVTNTVMISTAEKKRIAEEIITFLRRS